MNRAASGPRRAAGVPLLKRSAPRWSRRAMLRGMVGGAAVTVGLPLLDLFLNDNGAALAQGGPLPVRFGTWFWGCGINTDRWVPAEEGADWPVSIELAALADVKQNVSVLSGFDTVLDGRANYPHWTGVMAMLTGTVPLVEPEVPEPTLDILIARQIGTASRFRSLEMSATGTPTDSYSRESASIVNASAVSPLELYARIFGPEFRDPSDDEFMPDPRTVLRQSALSAVGEDAARLEKVLGSHDRQRLDQYFTSLRQLERQIEVSLAGPPDLAACARPPGPAGEDLGADLTQATATHALLTDLLVHASCATRRGSSTCSSRGERQRFGSPARTSRITSSPTTRASTRSSAISLTRRSSRSRRWMHGRRSSPSSRRPRKAREACSTAAW